MKKTSLWKESLKAVNFESLKDNLTVDVAVIGGGITGITIAYLLTRLGLKVVVLEAWKIGDGTTGFSTGNLYSEIEEQLQTIQSKYDTNTAREVAASRSAAIQQIGNLIKECAIDCGFHKVPWYLISENKDNDQIINKEYEVSIDAGLDAHKEIKVPLPFPTTLALRIENQAQFNPLQYLQELALNAEKTGCLIFEHSKVTKVEEGSPNTAYVGHYTVTAKHVVYATHTPKGMMFIQTLLGPYREYALAVKLNTQHYPEGIFWTSNNQKQYSIRSYTDNVSERYLLILGEPHKVGQKENNEECYRNLETYIRGRFDVKTIEYRWGAQHYRPADGLPYIGSYHKNSHIYIATGYSTDGLTYGTLAAMIITDLIVGNENKWAKLYSPQRHNLAEAAGKFMKENLNVLVQYAKEIPYRPEVEHLHEIKPGEGKTVKLNGEKYAAFRDEKNDLHIVSSVCTHMQCIVNWNQGEQSWDCPCHGSRFTIDGAVIEGPAISDLPKMKQK